MTISHRLTRAGLTFIILGTVAAVLPQQSETAIADNNCSSNSSYALFFASSGSGTTDTTNFTMPVEPPVTTGTTGAPANLVFPMISFGGKNRKISDKSFTAYSENVSFSDNAGSPGSITGGSQSQAGVTPATAQPGGANTFAVTTGNGYALSFTESAAGSSGMFTDSVTVTDSTNNNTVVTLSETAFLNG